MEHSYTLFAVVRLFRAQWWFKLAHIYPPLSLFDHTSPEAFKAAVPARNNFLNEFQVWHTHLLLNLSLSFHHHVLSLNYAQILDFFLACLRFSSFPFNNEADTICNTVCVMKLKFILPQAIILAAASITRYLTFPWVHQFCKREFLLRKSVYCSKRTFTDTVAL